MSWSDRSHLRVKNLDAVEPGHTIEGGWGRRKQPQPIADDDLAGQIAMLKQLRADANEKRRGRDEMVAAIDKEIEQADEAVERQTARVVTLINELDPLIKARIEPPTGGTDE